MGGRRVVCRLPGTRRGGTAPGNSHGLGNDMTTFRAACLQLNSGNDPAANLATLRTLAHEAAARGAQFVFTPEYALLLDGSGRVMRERAFEPDGGAMLTALQSLARELNIWLLVGSLTVRTDEPRIANRSFLISAEGTVVATYDKIHMFDVTLPDGKVIRESSAYRPGDRAVTAATPWGRIGLTVCYDLRFPTLFRALAQAGAAFITVPSSFQRQTGRAHWHPLLRARHRKRVLSLCARHVRRASRQPPDLRPLPHRGSVGRYPRGGGRGGGHHLRGDRSGAWRARARDDAVPRTRSPLHACRMSAAHARGAAFRQPRAAVIQSGVLRVFLPARDNRCIRRVAIALSHRAPGGTLR